MRYLFLFALLSITFASYSQYTYDWNMIYGTVRWDEARCLVETQDHSLVMAGNTQSRTENKQIYVLKVNEKGKKIWDSIYTQYYTSSAECVVETKNHELVIAGYCIKKSQYFSDFLVIKLDKNGNIIWEKTYGKFDDEVAKSIVQTSDGGFAITGYTDSNPDSESDVWVVKIDESGNQLWEYSFGGSKVDYANCIIQTKDQDLVIAGYTRSKGATQRGSVRSFWLIKLDNLGNEKWNETYGESYWDIAASVTEADDRSLYVAGYTKGEGLVNYDVLVVKVDLEGTKIWSRVFGGNEWEEATSIVKTYDNCVAIGGFSRNTSQNSSNFWLLKLDADGNEAFNRVFKRQSLDYSFSIIQTYDMGLAMAGTTFVNVGAEGWDLALLKFYNDRSPKSTFSKPNLRDEIVTSAKYKLSFSTRSNLQLDSLQVIINDTLRKDQFGEVRFLTYDTIKVLPSKRKKEEAKFAFFKSYDKMMQRILLTDSDKLFKYYKKSNKIDISRYLGLTFEKEYRIFSKENSLYIRASNADGTRYSEELRIHFLEFPWITW